MQSYVGVTAVHRIINRLAQILVVTVEQLLKLLRSKNIRKKKCQEKDIAKVLLLQCKGSNRRVL